jgi:hypothetical protein
MVCSNNFSQNVTSSYESLVKSLDRLDYDIDTMMGGKEQYGELYLRDQRADLMDAWLAPHPILTYVPERESVGIAIPAEGKDHRANKGGIKLVDSLIDLNLRDVGKYVSLEYTFRHNLTNYMKSDEGKELSAFLNKSGFKSEDIEYVAIGFIPDNAIYAVKRLSNGKIAIYANKDSRKKIMKEVKAYDMDENEFREVAIAEEIAHIFRKSKASIKEERRTKTSLWEFYESLTDKTSNPELKAKYERIMEHLEHDIATVARYASLYNSDPGKLEMILEAEAIMEGGMTSKEEISDYVSAKLSQIAKAAEKESAKYENEDGDEVYAGKEVSEESTEGTEVCAEAAEAEASDESESEGAESSEESGE